MTLTKTLSESEKDVKTRGRKFVVAVADDSEMILAMYKSFTQRYIAGFNEIANFVPIHVENVITAIEKIKEVKPNLLLLDHHFGPKSGGDGLMIAKAIKENGLSKITEVISFTTDKNMAEEYLSKYGIKYISKKNSKKIIEKIRQAIL